VNEIDDECQSIDDEWIEFRSDFDDQKQEFNRIENQMKVSQTEITRFSQWIKDQENAFQLMITNQPTLELKMDKLQQLKVEKKQRKFFAIRN